MTISKKKSKLKNTVKEINAVFRLHLGAGWQDRFGLALHQWAKKSAQKPIHVLSLFSGAGGLDIGFHDAGFTIHTMVEVNRRFIETLQANCGPQKYFDEATPRHIDIKKFTPPKDLKVDFIIGGPPCQTFSAAGRRMAGVKGTSDELGQLFRHYVRILRKLSPRGFLFENVYGLTGAEDGQAWKKIKQAFAKAGYKVSFRIIDAADYGVPQHRKRLFIVGTKKGTYRFPKPIFGPASDGKTPYFTAGQILRGIAAKKHDPSLAVNGRYGKLLKAIPPGLNYTFYTEKTGHPRPIFAWRSKFYDFLYKADPKSPIRTLKARGGQYTGPFHWNSRRFTVAEMKRLQTIPDNYQILGSLQTATEQIGNSVPPQLARILAVTILNQVFKVELPFDLPLLEENQSLKTTQRKNRLSKDYAKKTKAAIEKAKKSLTSKRARKKNYIAYLSKDFGWTTSKHHNAAYVEFLPTADEWKFTLSHRRDEQQQQFSITITPTPNTCWALKVKKITLIGTEINPTLFTGAWKALERELARQEIKADLIQLCGYYYYRPAFQCTMSYKPSHTSREEWKVVSSVVSSMGVGKILSAYKLSKLWDIPKSSVLSFAVHLRSLGYEVRNHNTNPQIREGYFLIPYAFPTLTPLSVQLKKKLGKIYGQKA